MRWGESDGVDLGHEEKATMCGESPPANDEGFFSPANVSRQAILRAEKLAFRVAVRSPRREFVVQPSTDVEVLLTTV